MVHFNFDETLILIGELGRYQVTLYILLGLLGLPSSWQNLSMVFLGGNMQFWCADEDSVDGPPPWESGDYKGFGYNFSFHANGSSLAGGSPVGRCTKTVFVNRDYYNSSRFPDVVNSSDLRIEKCHTWIYDRSHYLSTIISQYNLVCGDEWKISTATSIYMAGFLVGVVAFGYLSDRFGRHRTLLSSLLLLIVSGVAAAFAPEYISFVLLRFVVGSCSGGGFTVGFVIVMETIGPTKRMSPGVFYQGWFAVGIMIQAGFAYFVRSHIHLQLVQALPVVLFLSYWWIVSESPRWLVTVGRISEAEVLVKKIAKINGRTEVQLGEMVRRFQAGEVKECVTMEKPNIVDVLRAPNLRSRTCNVSFHWFVISMVYYGLSLGSGSLGGSVYINHFLSGLVEIPSFFITIFTMDRFGRKKVMLALHVFGGVACLACTPLIDVPNLQPLLVTCAMMGKFAVAANFAVIYVYSAEIFPTVVRNVGVGAGSMCARIGSLLAPQISRLDTIWRPSPFLFYGGLPLIAAILVFFLPETLHQKLPETIEDGEKFGTKLTIYEAEIEKSNENPEGKSLNEINTDL
ncbi:organic cation transporter protein-like isoform X2 [Liolophura sinensis]|uniref:organic cation transporter protein-like isoform X2 n=1 Tax=Liolophura sinensis TaxID=3198878 RepID=UPI0031587452